MEIIWKINTEDQKRILDFYEKHKETPFVKTRLKRNVDNKDLKIDKEIFWFCLINCLLTTQQKSGPKSAVKKFTELKPFPLSLNTCLSKKNIEAYAQKTLSDFGGIRMSSVIAHSINVNLEYLNGINWNLYEEIKSNLVTSNNKEEERRMAEKINDQLRGFGPKQSRNLLQMLGLTKYEIPIDSRILKWLNEFGFPVKLGSASLQDKSYYNLISDGIQELCKSINVYPCLIDAAIFSSFDSDGWTDENSVF